jgi:hypothetical protein
MKTTPSSGKNRAHQKKEKKHNIFLINLNL